MRTLQIYSGNLYGGVERTITTIATTPGHFQREFALCFDGRLRTELRALGVQVHDLGRVRGRRPWTVARARRALRTVLERRAFDVAICHSAWSQAIFGPIVRRAGLPLVFWLHDVATGRHWLERWARLTRPDLVICNSRFTARSVASLYSAIVSFAAPGERRSSSIATPFRGSTSRPACSRLAHGDTPSPRRRGSAPPAAFRSSGSSPWRSAGSSRSCSAISWGSPRPRSTPIPRTCGCASIATSTASVA